MIAVEQEHTHLSLVVNLMTPALVVSVGACQADPEGHFSEWGSEGSSWWSEEPTDVTRGGKEERKRRMTLSGTEGLPTSSAEESNLPLG